MLQIGWFNTLSHKSRDFWNAWGWKGQGKTLCTKGTNMIPLTEVPNSVTFTQIVAWWLQWARGRDSQCSSVQSLSRVRLLATSWTTARQASPSITNSQSSLKLMSIESLMPSNHLILCRPLLLLPSIFPSFRAFSKESVLRISWPKFWSFSFSISPSSEY